MRTLLAASMVVAGFTALAAPLHAQGLKIAYLDSRRVLAEAPGADAARSAIQQEQQRLQTRVQAMSDSLDAMNADYQKQSVLLSPDEKKKREDALRARYQQMQQRVQFLQEESNNKQQDLMEPVLKKVEGIIETMRKEGGYAIIFDMASQGMVSADSTLDLTGKVLERLKAQSSAAPAKN
jgi:outer membrane protein